MGVVILILIFTCILMTIGIFLIEMKTKIRNQLMQGVITRQSVDDSVWMSKQIGGDAAPSKLQKSSLLRDALATIGRCSNSGVLFTQPMESPGVLRPTSTQMYPEAAHKSSSSGMLQRI
ncbi:hypothetical protein BKA69DRAFT_229877 [Paraphysoderma sedebokerense]|nr:hypothetical protein BKA69DRAFT_229877 [Paraphysoderma sedebokerense]